MALATEIGKLLRRRVILMNILLRRPPGGQNCFLAGMNKPPGLALWCARPGVRRQFIRHVPARRRFSINRHQIAMVVKQAPIIWDARNGRMASDAS